jgi:hypothetical protein
MCTHLPAKGGALRGDTEPDRRAGLPDRHDRTGRGEVVIGLSRGEFALAGFPPRRKTCRNVADGSCSGEWPLAA